MSNPCCTSAHRPTADALISRRLILLCAIAAQLSLSCGVVIAAESATHFEQHIRPLLVEKCVKCHGEKKQEGNLRLDSLQSILKGGDSGPAIVPGKPGESVLIEAIKYEGSEMPPSGMLPDKEIRNVELWVARGAVWPENLDLLREPTGGITDADRQWWAFQPLDKPPVPVTAGDDWSTTPIDRFVYARLADKGMQPAAKADKVTLIRRLYFDLVGMPPTPEEVDDFVENPSADAWEELVDRLLDDPRYGEHWARHWLDVVRFSESDGWNQDAFRPHIWRYRDYVVTSFNEDKPYPQFVREQLAGDEIRQDNPEHLAAAGFLRLGIYEYNQRDARGHWNDIMNEMTDVAGDVFLGMGMACARCHDHKFDPLLQTDYFKLRAFFEPISWRDDLVGATKQQKAEHAKKLAAWEAATQEIRDQIDAIIKPYHDRKWKSTVEKFPLDIQAAFNKPVQRRNSWEHQMAYLVSRQFAEEGGGPLKSMKKEDKAKYDALQKQLAAFDDIKPAALPKLMTATDFAGQPAGTMIPDAESTTIEPGFLSVLCTEPADEKAEPADIPNSTGRRTALAKWIGRPDNPLTTRVIVNRIWQQHFGQGIVATANDFGHLGQPPTHPDLLDWLTVTFVENGWRSKYLHKLILLSSVWQQSAHHRQASEYQEIDPAENLLWRTRVRRLSAEQIRDAMLSVSGELQTQIGGPSVDAKTPRRALYVKNIRNTPDAFLHAFDVANGLKSVSQRNTTTTPTQSLMMINGDYALARAKKLAERLASRECASPSDLLTYAFRLTWGRGPTQTELDNSLRFFGVSDEQPTAAIDKDRLVDFCHVLLNANQFLYVD